MLSSSVTVLICSLQVQSNECGYEEVEHCLKKEDSVVPICFKEMSEPLNECSSIRTVHPKDVWPKITCELTCHIPVTTMFSWQSVTKSVDPV